MMIMDTPQNEKVVDPELGSDSKSNLVPAETQNKEDEDGLITNIVVILVAAVMAIFMLIGTIIGVTVCIPLLLATLFVTRLARFMGHGEENDNISRIRYLARNWLFLGVTSLLIVMGIFLGIAGRVTDVKHNMIGGVSILTWVNIVCIICGFSHLSYVILMLPYSIDIKVPEGVSEIVDCLIFLWARYEVVKRLPVLQDYHLLGLQIQKWVKCFVFILIGYNIITLFTHFIVWLLWTSSIKKRLKLVESKKWLSETINQVLPKITDKVLPKVYLLYYANGMRIYVSFVLTSIMILLTWLLYFGNRLGGTHDGKSVLTFGNWTLICLVAFSFLWLLKALILLSWEAHAIYVRLKSKILQAGKQLYFLGIITRSECDIFSLQRQGSDDDSNTIKEKEEKKRHKIRSDLILPKEYKPTIYEIQQVARSFLVTKNALKDMNVQYILEKLKLLHDPSNIDGNVKEKLRVLIVGENENNAIEETQDTKDKVQDFEELLQHATFLEGQSCHKEFQTWMERSRINCLLTGNILSNAKEAVDCLDKIISWILIGITFIVWLIATGLASTQVLVLVASPLLAATFVFGDTLKSLFQGTMFVYVVHPFDVGDLCAIDGKLLEVKSIGVWKTIFSNVDKVGELEEVIFPNSELATKVVVNHKTEYDCNDYVEFNLDFKDDDKIEKLINQTEDYLNREDAMFTAGSHSVAVLTTENSMKITVRFGHKIKLKDYTYFECLKTKDKRRTAFILYVQNLVKKVTGGKKDAQAQEETANSSD